MHDASDASELTAEERRAIAKLKRAARNWPDTLWIFGTAGGLRVMKFKPDGTRAITPFGGMDPDFVVATISGIECDGGDW